MNKINFSLKNLYKKFAVMITMALVLSPMGAKAEGNNFQRLNGKNRYETASAISKYGWTQSQYVLIANGENFPDALCSVPLAKKYNAPILLTRGDTLSKETEDEIKRLGAKNIIIVGGEGSISLNIEKYIKSNFKSAAIERIWGKNRYETSLKIAEKLDFKGDVVIASSIHYADALSIAPIAATKGMPILITEKDKLSDSSKKYLKDKKLNKAYIIGGEAVISNKVAEELSNATRIGGRDRFETNVEILKAFEKDLDFNNVFAALGKGPRGNEFADALSGAALAAKMNGAMVLSYSSLPEVTGSYLTNVLKDEVKVFALGGEAVLPNSGVENIKPSFNIYNKDEQVLEKLDLNKSVKLVGKNITIKDSTIKGNLYINGDSCTLNNVKIQGDIIINPGKTGSATLENVEANSVKVLSGKEKGIKIKDAKVKEIVGDKNLIEEEKTSSTGGGSNSGNQTPSEDKQFKVEKFYLKGSDNNIINGEIKDGNLELDIPADYNEKITNVVFTTSNSINSVTAMGQQITKEQFEKVYGKGAKEFDFIIYLRSMGFDKEGDGVGVGNINLLNGSTITFKDDTNNEVKYKLVIK